MSVAQPLPIGFSFVFWKLPPVALPRLLVFFLVIIPDDVHVSSLSRRYFNVSFFGYIIVYVCVFGFHFVLIFENYAADCFIIYPACFRLLLDLWLSRSVSWKVEASARARLGE